MLSPSHAVPLRRPPKDRPRSVRRGRPAAPVRPGGAARRTAPPRFAALLPAFALAGCGGGEAAPAPSQVADSAGVRIVDVAPEWLDEPAPIELAGTPHLRLGAADGPETVLFSTPIAAERLSDRRLFVVESGERRSRLLDPDGAFLGWVGAGGDGPAEYRRAAGGGVLPGDTLWIWDGARRRTLFFDPEGAFVRGVAIEPPDGAAQVRFVRPLPDGSILHAATNLATQAIMESDGTFHERVMVHRLDREGREARLLLDGPGSGYRIARQEGAEGQAFMTVQLTDPVFGPLLQVEADGEGRIWSGSGARFEIRMTGPGGELEQIVRVGVEPPEVTAAIRRHFLEASLERAPEPAREGLEAHLEQRGTARSLPSFGFLRTDEAGLLWVSEYVGHVPGAQPGRWWLVEGGGGVLGHVALPPTLDRVLHIGEDELLGVERDELDVPYVVAYRIARGGRAASPP
jgi:hypothetical protein